MPATRRGSLVGAVLLVALGLFLLYSNFRPGLDPWPLLSRYWPVLLIFLGLGKIWDQFRPRDTSETGRAGTPGLHSHERCKTRLQSSSVSCSSRLDVVSI